MWRVALSPDGHEVIVHAACAKADGLTIVEGAILHREPDLAEEQRHRDRSAQADAWFAPMADAPPLQTTWRRVQRWVHVQRSAKVTPGMPGSCLGKVPWETHVAACVALRLDPEREAARGGLAWDDMATALGEAPGVWVAW